MKVLFFTGGLMLMMIFITCKKEGIGGKAKIIGNVEHHGLPVPNAKVYIKYGAKEFPGTNTSNYDASTNANTNAQYQFDALRKGNYYLFSIGYDSAISANVMGGIPADINTKTTSLTTDIPVTE